MSEAHIQATIRQFINSSRQSAHSTLFRGFAECGQLLAAGLPALPLHQIRAICRAQEQTVTLSLPQILEKVIPMKPYDLYE
jgi:hypothetical protein